MIVVDENDPVGGVYCFQVQIDKIDSESTESKFCRLFFDGCLRRVKSSPLLRLLGISWRGAARRRREKTQSNGKRERIEEN